MAQTLFCLCYVIFIFKGVPTYIPPSLSKQELDAIMLRIRIEEIGWKVNNNIVDLEHYRQRSPRYDISYLQ